MAVQNPQEREHYNQWMKNQVNEGASVDSSVTGAGTNKQAYTDEQMQMDSVEKDEDQMEIARAMRREQVSKQGQKSKQRKQKKSGGTEEDAADEGAGGSKGASKKFGTMSFVTAFSLAAVKDAVDFLSVGWVGVLTNIFVLPALIMIMVMSGSGIKDFLKKRKSALMGIAVLEFLPFLSFVPAWTIAVLWAKIESDLGVKISAKGAAKAAGNMKKSAQMRLLRRMQARRNRQERSQQEQRDIEG